MQVLDLNDNDPSPSFQSSQDAAADAPPNTSIYDLFAVDPDFGRNGTTGLTFTVTGNDNFYIDGQTLRNRFVCCFSFHIVIMLQIKLTQVYSESPPPPMERAP